MASQKTAAKILIAALLASAGGCKKDEIAVYRIAKEGLEPQAEMMPAATAELSWNVPEGWKQLPASGMRLASFLLRGHNQKQADISVVALPGDAGGELANINRWRGQIGLAPLDSSQLTALAKRVPSAAGSAIVVDFLSAQTLNGAAQKTRVLGSILSSGGKSWFIKMSGEDGVVAAAKPSFIKFLKSLRPNA